MKCKQFLLGITTFFMLFFNTVSAQYIASEWETRDKWMKVSDMFDTIGVEKGMTVADIGCHEGYLTIHLSKSVGDTGKVFAVDVREDRLDKLNEHINKRKLKNITTILGEYDDPKLPEGLLDIVMIVDTYHEMEDYMEILKKVKKSLKPDGKILILEKLKSYMTNQSREEQMDAHTLESKYVKDELKRAGFTLIEEIEDFGRWKNESDKKIWFVIAKNNSDPKEN